MTHPNLVCLYELFVEDTCAFFTMELVNGVNFVDYVRGRRAATLPDRVAAALRQLWRCLGAASLGQAAPRHQAIQRAGDAEGAS